MDQKQKSFEEKLAFGKEGEHEVGEYFMNRGYALLPLYQFSEKLAPKVYCSESTIISPDILVSGYGSAFWIEVKTKNRWVKFNGKFETGLNEKHYIDYRKIQEKTTLPLYVVFNHKEDNPGGFFFVNILTPYNRIWDGINRATLKQVSQRLVLWEIGQLKKIL